MTILPDPVVGLPMAFFSHFILDIIPHHDYDLQAGMKMRDIFEMPPKRKYFILGTIGLDLFLCGCSFLWLYLSGHPWWIIAGAIAAISPDLAEQSLMVAGFDLPGWQNFMQWRVSAKYGFISYPVVSAIALAVIQTIH